MNTVVIGLGDTDRGDDGAGPAVAAAVGRLSDEFVVVIPDDDPAALLDALALDGTVVIVDAIASGAPPGTIRRFDDDLALPARAAVSTHGLDLAEALGLARALGRLPAGLVVYGVEAADVTPGRGLSSEVAHAVDELAQLIVRERRAA